MLKLRSRWKNGAIATFAFGLLVAPAGAVTTMLTDNFNDNSIDGSKWNVVTSGIPQAGAAVVEQNQQIELTGRGHLNTVAQFDPLTQPEQGVRITGQWTFVSNDDLMQVLTRTAGTPSGGFGETINGLEFQVAASGSGNNMTVTNRGGITLTGLSNNGALNAAAGETYNFTILDTGANVYFTMSQVGGTKQRTVVATTTTNMPADLISFHNRESGRRSNIDNIVIDSPSFLGPTNGAAIYLKDNFDDNSLDASKWKVVTAGVPNGGGSVTETNSRIQLNGRAHLVTQNQFLPTDFGLRIEGRYTFGSDDFLQVLTRSDGTPGGSFGETLNGIEFAVIDASNTMSISRKINGASVSLGSLSLDVTTGEVFNFLITDDGNRLTFALTQLGGDGTTAQLSAVSNQVYLQNFVVFHNRENGRTSFLDDVVISQMFIPEPATATLGLLSVAGLMLRRRRMA